MEINIVAAFESWQNGGIQTSALYLASEDGQEVVNQFVDDSMKDSFANLHVFYDEEDAKKKYTELNS